MTFPIKSLSVPLRGMLAVALCFFMFPGYAAAESLADDFPKNYQVIGHVSTDDLNSLEKVLSGGGDAITGKRPVTLTEFPEVTSRSHFPQIIYNIAAEATPVSKGPGGKIAWSVGNSLVLNSRGFFVTAYHCIETLEKEQRLSDSSLLVYGPSLNMVLKGRILAFSKKYDLALGKVELPDNVKVRDVTITKGNIEPSQILYSKRYRNLGYIKSDLLKNVLHANLSEGEGRSVFSDAVIQKTSPSWRRPLGMEVCMGYTINARFEAGSTLSGPASGQYFLMTDTRKTAPGHSGSPLFSLNGDLAGIVVEIPEKSDLFRNPKGDGISVTYFTGPEKIRGLIRNYLLHSTPEDGTRKALAANRAEQSAPLKKSGARVEHM